MADILCVILVGDQSVSDTEWPKVLRNITSQIEGDVGIHICKNDTINMYLHMDPTFCQRPDKSISPLPVNANINPFFYKDENGVSRIAEESRFSKQLDKFYNKCEKLNAYYDVSRNEFTSPSPNIPRSKHIKPRDRVLKPRDQLKSSANEYNQHNQQCRPAKNKNLNSTEVQVVRDNVSSKCTAVRKQAKVHNDASKQQFISPKPAHIRFSKRIKPRDRVICFVEERKQHDEQFRPIKNKNATVRKRRVLSGYVSSKYSEFHKQVDGRVLPYENKEHSLPPYPVQATDDRSLEQDFPVQATDGPFENVDLELSATVGSVTLDEPASGRLRVPSRHPDYESTAARRQTFTRWPHQHDLQDVEEMVRGGLFYTGHADLVRCYQCGLGLRDWSHVEDPLLEHIRYSPHCLHLADIVVREELERYRVAFGSLTSSAGTSGTPTGTSSYRHPEYQSHGARLGTFTRWPSDIRQRPQLLAEAGFYYTGLQDQVRCYACDGGLQHWDSPDEPWVEHARWFPHCAHVRRVMGEGYINTIQAAYQQLNDDPDDLREDGEFAVTEATGADGTRQESDDPIYSPEAQKVIINLGFSKSAVRMAIQECEQTNKRWNSNILADLLYDKQARGEVLPVDSPRPESPVLANSDVSSDEGVAAENQRLSRRLRCIMCEVNDANILFLPCAHRRMCTDCASDAEMCPICTKPVKQKVKTYMA